MVGVNSPTRERIAAMPGRQQVDSVRDAARRVRPHRRTIQQRKDEGTLYRRYRMHRVEIDEDELLAWFRKRLIDVRAARFGTRRDSSAVPQ